MVKDLLYIEGRVSLRAGKDRISEGNVRDASKYYFSLHLSIYQE